MIVVRKVVAVAVRETLKQLAALSVAISGIGELHSHGFHRAVARIKVLALYISADQINIPTISCLSQPV